MAEKNTSKFNALYTDHEENVRVEIAGVNAIDVDITLIDRNPAQPRKTFNEESLREMATSVATYGVLQPLLVTEEKGRYLIIAGERRFRAAYMAGLKKVPVIVRELTSQQIAEISLIENLHREDLNAIEAAEGMRELMENHNLTQEGVAGRIGKSRPYVTNTLRLLQLPKEVTDMVKEGRLSPGHARALISIDDKNYLIQLAKQACDSHLSVRDLETKVRLYFTRKTIFGWLYQDEIINLLRKNNPYIKSSALDEIECGKKCELKQVLKTLVAYGKRYNIKMKYVNMLYKILNDVIKGRRIITPDIFKDKELNFRKRKKEKKL